MRQQLELLVLTEVDHDKQTVSNSVYQKALTEAIQEAIKKVIGTPKNRTTVDFEYSDPL